MKVTLKVIAEETGVSQMTVSRILRGKALGQVSEAVRKKVVSALEKHGYDFQKPERRQRQIRSRQNSAIHCVIPYENFLKCPPAGYNPQFYYELRKYAAERKVKLNFVVGLSGNNPVMPNWDNLELIKAGDLVLFNSTYGMACAITLQRRGCRIAIVLRDLFWRSYYAPQLKTMAQFVIRTADGVAQTVRYLLDSGCRKIACCAFASYMHEPGHPVLSGYDYVLRLRGSSYRQVIPIPTPGQHGDLPQCVRKAWDRKPFDGLLLPSFSLPENYSPGQEKLHHYLGLPDSVRITAVELPGDIRQSGASAVLHFPCRELLPDVFDTLFAKDFSCVEKFYDCKLETAAENSNQKTI